MDQKLNQPLSDLLRGIIVNESKEIVNTSSGGVIDLESAQNVYKLLFSNADYYSGTTHHLPSSFWMEHLTYLKYHQELQLRMTKSKSLYQSFRILIVSEKDLKADNVSQDYSKFFDWHNNYGVDLYQIDKTKAEKIREEVAPSVDVEDIGVWNHKYTIEFGKLEKNKLKRWIRISGNKESPSIYQQCKILIHALKQNSSLVQQSEHKLLVGSL
jgi:hypothetical protein